MKNVLFVATQPQRFFDQCLFATELNKIAPNNIQIKFFIGEKVAGIYKKKVEALPYTVINPVRRAKSSGFFSSSLKNSLKSVLPVRIQNPLKRLVVLFKTTPLYTVRLRRQEEAFHNSFIRRYKLVSECLTNSKIDLIFINGDRHLGDEPVFLKAAEDMNIPIVIPYLVDFADKERILRLGSGVPVVKRKWFVSEYVRMSQEKLKYPSEGHYPYPYAVANVLSKLGVLTSNYFVMGSGKSSILCLNNKYSADKYAQAGVKREKIRIIGDISYDGLYEKHKRRNEIKTRLIEIYGLNKERKIIIAALPQLAEHGLLPWNKHWEEINSLVSNLCGAGASVLLSLHPKMKRESYAFLESAYGCRILDERLVNVLPAADVFVATFSSTVVWSVLCGVNTVVVDFYGLDYTMYDFLKSVGIVRDKTKLPAELGYALNSVTDFSEDWEKLSRKEVFDGNTIRRYEELILEVCRK